MFRFKQCAVIEFIITENDPSTYICRLMLAVYNDWHFDVKTARCWVMQFHDVEAGQTDFNDKLRSGRPATCKWSALSRLCWRTDLPKFFVERVIKTSVKLRISKERDYYYYWHYIIILLAFLNSAKCVPGWYHACSLIK